MGCGGRVPKPNRAASGQLPGIDGYTLCQRLREDARRDTPVIMLTAQDQDVVYVQQGETYHTRPIKLGRRDAERAEVLEGLKAGERVVVAQSFLIKADIEKSTVEEE